MRLRSCYALNIQSSSVLKNPQLNCIVLIYYVITFFVALRKTGWRAVAYSRRIVGCEGIIAHEELNIVG